MDTSPRVFGRHVDLENPPVHRPESRAVVFAFNPALDQQQQHCFPAIDMDFGPQWEFNFGVAIGATHSTDLLIVKCIYWAEVYWRHRKVARIKLDDGGR